MTRRWTVAAMAALVSAPAAPAQQQGGADGNAAAPLFSSTDVLSITIEGPLDRVFKERDEDEQESFDAVLWYHAADRDEAHDIKLRTRGKFRLQRRTCEFPPLRINFKKSAVEGTLFEGQDKIKLVTHCQDKREEYEQYVLQEYLIYRMYNLFTERSFRVRLARVSYVDTDGERDSLTKYAFLIEDDDAMAARNGYAVLDLPQIPPSQMAQGELLVLELFQYLIGNTDFDPFTKEPDDETCCHNTVLIGSVEDFVVLPVPYDFDWSGVISARYAEPSPLLGIRSVYERRFWGVCRPAEQWEAAFPLFQERREAIYDLFRSQPDLDPERLEESLEYFDEFYEIISDPRKAEREIVSRCRGRSG